MEEYEDEVVVEGLVEVQTNAKLVDEGSNILPFEQQEEQKSLPQKKSELLQNCHEFVDLEWKFVGR